MGWKGVSLKIDGKKSALCFWSIGGTHFFSSLRNFNQALVRKRKKKKKRHSSPLQHLRTTCVRPFSFEISLRAPNTIFHSLPMTCWVDLFGLSLIRLSCWIWINFSPSYNASVFLQRGENHLRKKHPRPKAVVRRPTVNSTHKLLFWKSKEKEKENVFMGMNFFTAGTRKLQGFPLCRWGGPRAICPSRVWLGFIFLHRHLWPLDVIYRWIKWRATGFECDDIVDCVFPNSFCWWKRSFILTGQA